MSDDERTETKDLGGEDGVWADFVLFLREEKRWWLGPTVGVLGALSVLLVFAEGSALAPFIYTMF